MERDRELFAEEFMERLDVVREMESENDTLDKVSEWMDRISYGVLFGVGVSLLGAVKVAELGYNIVTKAAALRERLLREIERGGLTDD